ncbi:MAG: 50S ribosomal protein L23 [bacterium]
MEKNLKLVKIKPRITEKSVKNVAIANQYTFTVNGDANKQEISDFVEKNYGVKVEDIKVLAIRAKRKAVRGSRKISIRGGGKKAVVRLKKGDTINEFDLSSNAKETKQDKETK